MLSREFSHRVKSISMASFKPDEINKLKLIGNDVLLIIFLFFFFIYYSFSFSHFLIKVIVNFLFNYLFSF